MCLAEGFRRCCQEAQQWVGACGEDDGGDDGDEGEQSDGLPDLALHLVHALGADRVADGHGDACGQADDGDGHQVGHLAAGGYGGYGIRAVESADDEQVYQLVAALQEAGDEVGDGEAQHGGDQWPVGQVAGVGVCAGWRELL